MTRLLIRLFVRNYRDTSSAGARERYGKFSGVVGIVTNLLLFAAKIAAGIFSRSIAITADAVNNLSDSAASVVTLAGFRMSAKPADREHPYGHARIEYISGLIVSIVIFVVGFQFARDSLQKIFSPEKAGFSLLSAGILAASIAVKIWQGAFYKKIGGLIHSETLLATAADSRSDVLSTAVVLAGALAARFTGYNLDGYLGVAVAALIMVTGYRLIRKTSNPLLGLAPSKELVDDIYKTIRSYDGILGIHDLNVHMYGPGRLFASVHCEVPAEQDILLSHDIIDNIERDFLYRKGIHLVIHMDPIVTDDPRTNRLLAQVREILRGLSPEISLHDFRVVWGPTHANLVFDVCVPFGFSMSDGQLASAITREIQKLNPHYYPVITVDHDYVPKETAEPPEAGGATKN
ncbi:MAG TPA: cation-efflux pump [Ruminococcaceae bacterium]|jgi:cation diffusion facilitator family transporter|nr:cation-efflux pump [Oscillospiraceae bacterium]HCB91771.1 cation-efflux pump [Oscillospiraceae bacterium]